MKFTLRAKTKTLKGKIKLPASKSISNRVLIIQALSKSPFKIENLSDADDTVILSKALTRNDKITDIGPAGTAMRFLTAYYASRPGEKVLTGSNRMKQRPISILVDALRQLGAQITYLEKEGFPPLHIEGRRLEGGTVKVSGKVSSQFITALMLIAPTLPQPLCIQIDGDPLSRPYISMTKSLMETCGAQVSFQDNEVIVSPGRYRSKAFFIEFDWSAAAFWMAFAALAKNAKLELLGLTNHSIQGDKAAIDVFKHTGILSTFTSSGLTIQKESSRLESQEWNFRNHPDLVQPMAVALAGLKQPFKLHGLDNLRLKESDRISAIKSELEKVGAQILTSETSLEIEGNTLDTVAQVFEAHNDHRMVMSIAALSMIYPEIVIKDPMVVAKSYPSFWSQVEKFVDVRPGK